MDKEMIDELFEEVNNDNWAYIWNLAGMEQPFSEENFEENVEECTRKIMNKIENEGDFSYFLTKMYTDKDLFIELIAYSSNIVAIKECIAQRDELHLNHHDKLILIEATKDTKYIKECIANCDELGLEHDTIVKLIEATKDTEYIKKCITRRDELSLTYWDIENLIAATEDKDYIEECIAKHEKLGFNFYEVANLIVATKDTEYIKECISKRNELGIYSTHDTVNLILATKDADYIKECIAMRREFGFANFMVEVLILATKDTDYIKECIIKRDKLRLNDSNLENLILATKDTDYIKECIIKRDKLRLNDSNLENLILATKDTGYIKECITKRNELGMNDSNLVKLILATEDKEYIQECLNNESLNLTDQTKTKLILISSPEKIVNNLNIKENQKIELPVDMTIGIEIENIGTESDLLRKNRDRFLDNWTCKGDGSLIPNNHEGTGLEVVSPILTGSNDKTTSEVYKVTTILKEIGQYTNDTCGGHIHIGADYLKSVEAWQNLIELWTNTEHLLYIIGNEKGNIPRNGVVRYAQPISRGIEDALNAGSINLENETDLQEFKSTIRNFQETRYQGINFYNLAQGSKGTIEFRLANGTVNPETWIENINLFGGIVRASQELAIIQSKNSDEITQEEYSKLEAFESLRDGSLNEKEKLEQLLKLVISEPNRYIYRERYEINSELLKNKPELEASLRDKTSKSNIKISKNKIGKQVFTDEDRVTGQDFKKTGEMIEEQLNRNMQIESNKREGR